MRQLSTTDFIDAFGSLIQVRINRGLNGIMIKMIRDEDRKWKATDVEKLIDYLS